MSTVIFVEYTPKEGKKDELLAALQNGAASVHAEAGCEKYAFHTTKDKVYLIESWATKEELAAHGEGEPLKALREATADLLAEPAKLTFLRPAPSGDPAKGQLV
ncbi:putative quinol monooxygenase [Blastococcus sp. Marseille-P5729]|uniref:putative quinol monooxygenase n=1 Tax=Blastococcus sp. Marseille-P5729 TaxID=2086582 RepID=UPI000D0FCA24|nr:antibiotic biosynthesis monooxygenase [Blastococcus sp. Marseille-P5729]